MIPFAILSAVLFAGEAREEIRILELSTAGFTYRLATSGMKLIPDAFLLHFFRQASVTDPAVPAYESCLLKDLTVTEEEKTSYYNVFRVETADPHFAGLAAGLTRDYLAYIEARQADAEPLLVGYPLEEDAVFGTPEPAFKADPDWELPPEVALALPVDRPDRYEKFLKLGPEAYAADFFRANGFEGHPVSRHPVDLFYIGNESCFHLLPDPTLLEKLLKACGDRRAVLVLPPARDSQLEAAEALVQAGACETVVNDWGLMYRFSADQVRRGRLLEKQPADPRSHYYGSQPLPALNSDGVLYAPWRITNMGGFCPLYARCHNGDRALQEQEAACPHYCLEFYFEYPEHLKMLGWGKGLYMLEEAVLTDSSVLRQYRNRGLKRLVLGGFR